MDQELTSMKMSKKESSPEVMPSTSASSSGPRFPWGLQVTLENESLKKMGIKLSDYKVGDMVELYAQCKVTRLSQSQNQSEGGRNDQNRTMELQITDMCLEESDEQAEKEKTDEDELTWEDDQAEAKLKKRGF